MAVVPLHKRGAIRDDAQYTQRKDYSELLWGKITPMDIDGFIDFENKAFVFIELKGNGADLPYGQRLAIERVCDACQQSGKESLVIVAHHRCAPHETIPVHEVAVTKVRYHGEWRPTREPHTIKSLIDCFREYALNK